MVSYGEHAEGLASVAPANFCTASFTELQADLERLRGGA
jgi:hypothetical protein